MYLDRAEEETWLLSDAEVKLTHPVRALPVGKSSSWSAEGKREVYGNSIGVEKR